MKVSMKQTLLLVSMGIFVLAAFGVNFAHVALLPLGLAFLAAALLL